ncbi:MAG: hypothetical protein ACSLEL_04630 [Candidatus Malihini olakiniferum]
MGTTAVGGIFQIDPRIRRHSHEVLDGFAECTDCLVDVHCDKTDDAQSRFLEALVKEVRICRIEELVMVSRTVEIGSLRQYLLLRTFLLLKRSRINCVFCLTGKYPPAMLL